MTSVDWRKARVTHPSGIVSPARFVFFNGIAAVWQEGHPANSASRILYATNSTFTRAVRGRVHALTTESEEWSIEQLPGCNSCGSKRGLLNSLSMTQLLDPDFTTTEGT